MDELLIKGLYDNVFDLINNKLPYVDNKHFEKELEEAQKLLNIANKTFEKYREVLDINSIDYFEYYKVLASGCLDVFSFINSMKELINDKDFKENLSLIDRCLGTIEVFVKHFENEEAVTSIVGGFLVHISSINEYYKAILADKSNDK